MLKYSIAFIVLLALPFKIFAQSREMGVMLGVMNYKGDLHPQMYDTKNNRPAIGYYTAEVTVTIGHLKVL